MKVGVTTFVESVKRVNNAVHTMPASKLEQGRVSVNVAAECAMRFVFSKEDKCLYTFGKDGGLFAMDKIDVELEDKDDVGFTFYLFPVHVLSLLSGASGELSIYKYRNGVRFIVDAKQKFYLASQDDLADYFEIYDVKMTAPDCKKVMINALAIKEAFNFTDYIPSGSSPPSQVIVFQTVDDYLCVGATDTWRLATYDNVSPYKESISASYFRSDVVSFKNMINSEDMDFPFYFDTDKMYFNDLDFWAGMLCGTKMFEIWEILKTLPERNFINLSLDVDLFVKAIVTTSSFAKEGAGYIKLEIKDGDAIFSANGEQVGNTTWTFQGIAEKDKSFVVGFNPDFMLSYLRSTKPKKITLNFSDDPNKAFSVQCENEKTELIIMPVMVHQKERVTVE